MTGFRFRATRRAVLVRAFGETCTRDLERVCDHYLTMDGWFADLYGRGAKRRRARPREVSRDQLAHDVYQTLLRHGVKLTAAMPEGKKFRATAPWALKVVLTAMDPELKQTVTAMRKAKAFAEHHAVIAPQLDEWIDANEAERDRIYKSRDLLIG